MKKNKKIFLILITIFLLLVNLTGCKKSDESQDKQNKVTQELDYLDTKITNLLNKLNNIETRNYTITSQKIQMGKENSRSSSGGGGGSNEESSQNQQKQSDNQNGEKSNSENSNITITGMEPQTVLSLDESNIDWNMIKSEIETLNEAWGIIILDLSYLNVNNTDIISFSSTLNNTLLSIKDNNKLNSLSNLAQLYSFIPKFQEQISEDNGKKNVKKVKSYLINAYSLLEKDDWSSIESNLTQADGVYNNIINDLEFSKNKEFKVNRTYVLLKELQNSLVYKDKLLFLVKYKNLIESIDTL